MSQSDRRTALTALENHPDWVRRACAVTDALGKRGVDPDLFYTPSLQETARAVCFACPVIDACRAYALGGSGWWEDDGVWGGTTPAERAEVRRAEAKSRSRIAQRGPRPVPVRSWTPAPRQRSLLQALQEQPDLRAAAEKLHIPFANTRWVYSQICEALGYYLDELTVPEVLEAAARAAAPRACPAADLRVAA